MKVFQIDYQHTFEEASVISFIERSIACVWHGTIVSFDSNMSPVYIKSFITSFLMYVVIGDSVSSDLYQSIIS